MARVTVLHEWGYEVYDDEQPIRVRILRRLTMETLEGTVTGVPGDWLVTWPGNPGWQAIVTDTQMQEASDARPSPANQP